MKHFRTYQLAKELYRRVKSLSLKGEVRDQLTRAALSICLNLAEGNCRLTAKDRKRFFNMALTSLREVQALVDLEELESLDIQADILGASLYRLCQHCV